jgi:hypothetical protein
MYLEGPVLLIRGMVEEKRGTMCGYLIYHQKRIRKSFENLVVHYDETKGNQDPYVWNQKFLHTFCHITGMSSEIGQTNFWVSGDGFPNFKHLSCDLVFTVGEKRYWILPNEILIDDPIVDSDAAFNDHYRWASQHYFGRRRRYTLKADPNHSFQPQTAEGNLLDIVPALNEAGLSLEMLYAGLKAGFQSKPMKLDKAVVAKVRDWLESNASKFLKGEQMEAIRTRHPEELSSPF